jgi:predicted nucleotidyltransferase
LKLAPDNSNIGAVIAVGSAVRPNVPSSDLDLIVICNDPSLLKANTPLEVDLRSYAAHDIDALVGSGHDMLGWAIKFGRALYQRDHYWDRMVESWRHRLPLPSAGLARERATAACRRLAKVVEFNDAEAAHEQAVACLTHLARAELLDRGIYPASRPELAEQLRTAGNRQLADWLDRILQDGATVTDLIRRLLKQPA